MKRTLPPKPRRQQGRSKGPPPRPFETQFVDGRQVQGAAGPEESVSTYTASRGFRALGRIVKLIAGNLAVFLVLIWSANLLSSIILDGQYVLEQWFLPVSKKSKSPSLADRDRAETVFREFSLLRTRYVPYLAWSREPFESEFTHVDEQGDRTHPGVPEAPAAHVRFFGGSTIWGKGVADADTIPGQFNRRHPDVAAHNHGESGFVSRQELARMVNLVNQDAPMDLVIFYDGCNDAYTLCRGDVSLNGHSRENKIAAQLRPGSFVVEDLAGSLREVIQFLLIRAGITKDAPSLCQQDPAYADQVAQTIVNNWRIARTLANEAGADFLAILQPLSPVGSPNIDYFSDGYRESSRINDYRAVYPLVQQRIRDADADWMHDFTDAFDRDEYIYIDNCHVNELGNRIIAERVDTLMGDALRQRIAGVR